MYYNISGNNVTLTNPSSGWSGYIMPTGTLVIPDNVTYNDVTYTVTSIKLQAFRGCSDLTSVIIPNSVQTINEHAFYECSGLQEITIGEGVTSIGRYAFTECPSLTTVHFNATNCSVSHNSGHWINNSTITTLTIGENVTIIPYYAFYGCSNLTSNTLVIPNSVTEIGQYAFYGYTNLEKLTIGEGVTSIGGYAFWNCPSLTTVHFNAINCNSMSTAFNSGTSSSNVILPLTVLTIGDNVTKIPYAAFKNCNNLTSNTLVIPNSVTEIGQYAFYGYTNLEELTIGEGVTSIGGYAFWNCPSLTTVHFNAINCNSMSTAFNSGTSSSNVILPLTVLTIGENVTIIPYYAFYGCSNLTSNTLVIPNSVTEIGQYAFYGYTNLEELTIGEGVTSIGGYAFWNCPSLTTVHFNAISCNYMSTNTNWPVFNAGTTNNVELNITTLSIGDEVTIIPDCAFAYCDDLSGTLVLPNSLTTIGGSAFYGCSSLSGTLVLPDSLTTICGNAFSGCSSLSGTLVLPDSLTTIGGSAFFGCSSLSGTLVLPNSLTTIGTDAFNGCSGIQEVTVGESVTSIGARAFWNCPSLVTVHYNATNCTSMYTQSGAGTTANPYVYSSVFNSGSYTSTGSSIVTLTIGENVTNIPLYAFWNCPALTTVYYDAANCEQFYNYNRSVFNSGTSTSGTAPITTLTIGEHVSIIPDYSFWKCPSLTTVNFNATNCTRMDTRTGSGTTSSPYVYYSVFNSGTSNGGSSAITTINIGDNVTRIPDFAFDSSTNLTSDIVIPNVTAYIGKYAFYGAQSSELTIGEGVTSIGEHAFWKCPSLTSVHFNATNCTQMYTRTGSGTASSPYVYYSVFNQGTSNGGIPAMTTLSIGNNVTSIPDYAFRDCTNLTSDIVIPNVTTYVGKYAFYGAQSSELMIGESIDYIGDYAFWNCPSLVTVHYNATNCTQMYTRTGSGTSSSPYVYYSVFSKSTNNGESAINTLTIGNNVVSIPAYAFRTCKSLPSVTIPNSVTYIGNLAFRACAILQEVTIPDGVTYVGDEAFWACLALEEVTIGEGVEHIGSQAFGYCPALTTVHFNATNCQTMVTGDDNSVFFSGSTAGGTSAITTVTFGDNVTIIPNYAFKNNTNLAMEFVAPETLTYIGDYAFYNCSQLTGTLTTTNTLLYVGQYAFYGTDIHGLTIADGVTAIGDYAFYNCDLDGILTIPNSVVTIGTQAFYGNANLQQVIIGQGVTSIGDKAFWNCPALTTVRFNAVNCMTMESVHNNVKYSVFSSDANGTAPAIARVIIGTMVQNIPDYAFAKAQNIVVKVIIPASVTNIGNYAFYGCSGLPLLTMQGNGLTTIGDCAFYNCNSITGGLTLSNSLTSIGNYAFYQCQGLTSVTMQGNELVSIGESAFAKCSSMQNVTIPNSVASIGKSAFANCSTLSGTITLPNSLTHINDYTFNGCSGISSVIIQGNEMDTIGNYAFSGCTNMQNFTLPNTITYIGIYAFNNCNNWTGTLNLPNSLTRIGTYAFYGCSSLSGSIIIPNSMSGIASSAFYGCSGIQEVTIGEGVIIIGNDAFFGCSSLTNVVIPNSVHDIYDQAFMGCTGLQEVTIGEGVTSVGGKAFWNCPSLTTVHFNAINCTSMYTSISDNAYSVFNSTTETEGSSPITTLTIGDNVETIPTYAFSYCSNLTGGLVLPTSLRTIGSYAFLGCSGLSGSLLLPNNLQTVGQFAFGGCSGFSGNLVLPADITSIGYRAFYNCSGFTGDLVLPANLTSLDAWAFKNCSGFDGSLIIGSKLSTIESGTFSGCNGFSGTLIIGRNITSVGEGAFQNCTGFTSIISECSTPPTAQFNSFNYMTSTIPVYIPYGKASTYNSVTGWNGFTNYVDQFLFESYDTNDWSDDYNWYTFELPTESDVVCISSDCQLDINANVLYVYVVNQNENDALRIQNGKTLTSTYGIGTETASQLIIEEGGQISTPFSNTFATVQKSIVNYTNDSNGWQLIGTPFTNNIEISSVDNMTSGEYDLYYYDEPTYTWINQKGINSFDYLEAGRGYLYAHGGTTKSETMLSFPGVLNSTTATVSVPLSKPHNNSASGFNLITNPFARNVISYASTNVANGCYRMNDTGTNLIVSTVSAINPLKPAEGFFVKATDENASITFNPQTRETINESGSITVEVIEKGVVIDRMIVKENGQSLEKISLEGSHTQLYADNFGEKLAIIPFENSDININFETPKIGYYTIRVNIDGLYPDYLYLIDHVTGKDIDLLTNPCYTFIGSTNDDKSRFTLSLNNNYSNNNANFVYQDGDEIILNQCGTLQAYDVMGRNVICRRVNGNERINISDLSDGVYIFRLVGDNVKTQKIVIR